MKPINTVSLSNILVEKRGTLGLKEQRFTYNYKTNSYKNGHFKLKPTCQTANLTITETFDIPFLGSLYFLCRKRKSEKMNLERVT